MPELHHRILSSIWSALITVLNILCAIVIVVAIFAASGYRFNCFSAVNILMCTGFGVEFTAHIVLVYVRKETGDNAERLTYALSQMLPPIVDGSISTLLSILPLAASKYPYVVLYFFGKTPFCTSSCLLLDDRRPVHADICYWSLCGVPRASGVPCGVWLQQTLLRRTRTPNGQSFAMRKR